ncbi:hypothetical protein [Xenorhabdus bovienii]|nr:hypothetical protein [Xenorhabdus bovienii]
MSLSCPVQAGLSHMSKGRFLPYSDSSFLSHGSMMAFTRQY